MEKVKLLVSRPTRRLACSPIAGLLTLFGRRGTSPAAIRWVSASAQTDAMLLELSAAATTEIQLVDGKVPDWITLVPAGTFQLVDGRGPFHNFDPEAVISASNARRGATELPGDYDHHIDVAKQLGIKGIACGWVKELKAEQGAVRARVEWTAAGAEHIRTKEFRYISPRFGHAANGNVLCILRFALTNDPAIKDLPAIAAAALNTPKENDVNLLQRLIGMLAISASATEDQVIDLVKGLFTTVTTAATAAGLKWQSASAEDLIAAIRNTPDVTKFVSASVHQGIVDELAGLKKTTADANTVRLTAEISAAVDGGIAKGQIPPAQKEFWISACTKSSSTDPVTEFLKTQPVILPPAAAAQGRPPIGGGEISASALDADQLEMCRIGGITAEQFAETRNAELRAQRART